MKEVISERKTESLEFQNQQRRSSLFSKLTDIEAVAEIADLSRAVEFREKTSLRQENDDGTYSKYPICSTSLESLRKYGMGLQLYFLFLKQLGLLFFVISLLSVWPMIENYNGKGFGSTFQNQRFIYFSLANQEGVDKYETDLEKAENMIETTEKNLQNTWPLDFIYCIAFLVFVLYYNWLSRRTIEKAVGKNYNIEDFTVEVKGFPPFITKTQIFDHFSAYGEVAEVYMSKIYEGKLQNYKKIYEEAYMAGVTFKISQRRKSLANTLPPGTFTNTSTLNKTNDELQIGTVFVVFNTVEAKDYCLKNHKTNTYKCCQKKNIRSTRRGSFYRLTLAQATNPSDIL